MMDIIVNEYQLRLVMEFYDITSADSANIEKALNYYNGYVRDYLSLEQFKVAVAWAIKN